MDKQGDGQYENEDAHQNLQKQCFLAGHGKPTVPALPETVPQVSHQAMAGMGTNLVGRGLAIDLIATNGTGLNFGADKVSAARALDSHNFPNFRWASQ